MPNQSIQLAVTSFVEAFPHSLLFVGHRYDFILLGSRAPIDLRTLERRFDSATPELREELARLRVYKPINLLARVVKSEQQLRAEYGGLPVISDERRDWAYARFDLAHPPQITYDPVQMLEQLEVERLENGALFAQTVTHAGLLRSFVQDFPLSTLMGLTGESIGAVRLHDADWNRIYELNNRAEKLTRRGKRPRSGDQPTSPCSRPWAVCSSTSVLGTRRCRRWSARWRHRPARAPQKRARSSTSWTKRGPERSNDCARWVTSSNARFCESISRRRCL